MTEISVIYSKANGLRKDQMRTRHQGGYWNEQVAGGQPQTCLVLVAVEPSVTTHNLYMGAKHELDALKSQLSSSAQRKKHTLPNTQTVLKVHFLLKLLTQDSITL